MLCYVHTWKEFMIVNIQMKTVVLTSTANIPMIHVIPNSGSNTTAPLIAVLKRHNELKIIVPFRTLTLQDQFSSRHIRLHLWISFSVFEIWLRPELLS